MRSPISRAGAWRSPLCIAVAIFVVAGLGARAQQLVMATNVMLPEIGVRGNTHFPMLDLNNVRIADLLSQFLKEHGLDRRK